MKTSIQIQKETREELTNLGKFCDTYDTVLQRLIDHAKMCDSWWVNKP